MAKSVPRKVKVDFNFALGSQPLGETRRKGSPIKNIVSFHFYFQLHYSVFTTNVEIGRTKFYVLFCFELQLWKVGRVTILQPILKLDEQCYCKSL